MTKGAEGDQSGEKFCELEFVKKNRTYYRSKVTRNHTFIIENVENMTQQSVSEYLDDFKKLELKLEDFNKSINKLLLKCKCTDNMIEEELEKCDEYDSKITAAVRLLDKATEQFKLAARDEQNLHRQSADGSGTSRSNNVSTLKLPSLPLPEFSNSKGESLSKFLTGFEAIINKYGVSPFEKFIYLERQLRKEPLMLVKSLSSEEQSFDTAVELLTKAFSSPTSQKFDIIRRLTELKLSFPGEPYLYVSELRNITDMVSKLKIDIQTVLQYFVWNSFNENFRNIMINITNKTKPSMVEINSNIFDAIERYNLTLKDKQYTKKIESENIVSGFAAQVDYQPQSNAKGNSHYFNSNQRENKYKDCILCVTDESFVSHPIYKCVKFPNARQKIDKLNNMKACTKCAYDNHKTSECRFRFRRMCGICNKAHFDFLCLSKSDKPYNNSGDRQNKEGGFSTGSISVNSACLSYNDSKAVVLPTFVCALPNGVNLRGMKDSGSQCNFIVDSVAKLNKFKIVQQNVQVSVNGFNSSQKFETDVVKIRAYFGHNIHDILAICIPRIPTSLTLPGLSALADSFLNRGLVLADPYLNREDKIENLDLILGSGASHCIPEKTVLFGSGNCSYISSPLGIMLTGSVPIMERNVHSLSNIEVDNFQRLDNDDQDEFDFEVNHIVVDFGGKLIHDQLDRVVDDALIKESCPALSEKCSMVLDYECSTEEEMSEQNNELVRFVLDNTERDSEGRLEMPLTWNSKVAHLLGQNFHLARQILGSNLRKLKDSPEKIDMIDTVIKDQLKMGVIEPIGNLELFLNEQPQSCFLAHMPIFKLDRDTTKCRNVYLSNLAGKDPNKPVTLSNNQCMLSGPSLNFKISTSFIHMRFDRFLMSFDLVKAFLQIALKECDQNRLCFLWYRNPKLSDFTVVGYRNKRLSFGLKCSPTLLMLALFKILMVDVAGDSERLVEFKKLLFQNFYMDNGSYTTNDIEDLAWAYNTLYDIFLPYKFPLQQFCFNNDELQSLTDNKYDVDTPAQVKLLGLIWDRKTDKISTRKLELYSKATTKRDVLKTIASNFDIYNFNGPLLNRSRLFLHRLQCDKTIDWDTRLCSEDLKIWYNISKQINDAPGLSVDRFVGKRSDEYHLVACTDASKNICGVVIYIYCVNSRKLSFLLAKNKIVGKGLDSKTIPILEFQGIVLGVETITDTYMELTGKSCAVPINITKCVLFTDSLVCLNWLNSYVNKLDKMKNRCTFVMNRMVKIKKMCEKTSVLFKFCAGSENPADCMTRELSYKQLIKSNFLTGPSFLLGEDLDTGDELTVTIPNPLHTGVLREDGGCVENNNVCLFSSTGDLTNVFSRVKFSSFSKMLRVAEKVFGFINNLKCRMRKFDPVKYDKFVILNQEELQNHAFNRLLISEQIEQFSEETKFVDNLFGNNSDVPPLVSKLNIYKDKSGVLRVKSKFARFKDTRYHPILLSERSEFTELIIKYYHDKLNHSGVYQVLNFMRKSFWLKNGYSLIKRIINKCIFCRKMNGRSIKINQSSYRDFRADPPKVPFRAVFIDHIGPFKTKNINGNSKSYILCITCLWTRAINLVVCCDLSLKQFLRSFQLHCFEFGVPEVCHSDLGSQIVAGANVIQSFISDSDSQRYFLECGISPLTFTQFPKGLKELGGLVETCVKMVKRLLFGAMGKNILSEADFYFLVSQTISLVNKRPVAFKQSIINDEFPITISPELIVKGYELPCINLIPELQEVPVDLSYYVGADAAKLLDGFEKLQKVRSRLINIYNDEFLSNLIQQATNKEGRYSPIKHRLISKGDIVLIKEDNVKRLNYPMGIIVDTVFNFQNEVTEVKVMKGLTREIVRRHASCIIPVLANNEFNDQPPVSDEESLEESVPAESGVAGRIKRSTAQISGEKTRLLFQSGYA